jgi:hypothetical protein
MTTLRQAVQEYLCMRRDLGFKLRNAGKGLFDFVRFMERRPASYITQSLALAWAQQPSHTQPAHWARSARSNKSTQRLTRERGCDRTQTRMESRR